MMPTYLRHEQGMLYIPAHANCEWELYRAFPFHVRVASVWSVSSWNEFLLKVAEK